MTIRAFISIAFAITIAVVASLPVSGQSASAPPLVITAYNAGPADPVHRPENPVGRPRSAGCVVK